MAPSLLSGKNIIDPVESTTKPAKPRKFAPQPVESSNKSSEDKDDDGGEKAKPRKFAVQPVETSVKSSKDKPAEEDETPKARRFAPEPIETSMKNSKNLQEDEEPVGQRHSPQLVETQVRTNRNSTGSSEEKPVSPTSTTADAIEKPKPRKFAPVLVDTARRTRKAGETVAPTMDYRTEQGHQIHAKEHRSHYLAEHEHDVAMEDVIPLHNHGDTGHPIAPSHLHFSTELRREASSSDGRSALRRSFRKHSYRCPDLDTIESSESEQESKASSLSSSPSQGSPITASDGSMPGDYAFKHATRIRESVDENFAGYLLQLEAKKAEQRMQEQALAAFANSDFHQPVEHFVNEDKDSDDMEIEDRPATWDGHDEEIFGFPDMARRESTAKASWEHMEMQRHAEKLESERVKQATAGPWWVPTAAGDNAAPDSEIRVMRDRARPPMLGGELAFPRCRSPDRARFDVTQGSSMLRDQMCYLTETAEASDREVGEQGGLWNGPQSCAKEKHVSNAKNTGGSHSKGKEGLWGGFCFDKPDGRSSAELGQHSGPSGLMTPRHNSNGPGAPNASKQSFASNGGIGIRTPPMRGMKKDLTQISMLTIDRLDNILVSDHDETETMSRDYPDSFVTQVYNYLSLGYPSLARSFDAELAKVSRVPLADLRQDDITAKASPRGYIRLGPDFEGGGGEGVTGDDCRRWQALKMYIKEWARQERNMGWVDGLDSTWGSGARRGSWAL